MSPLHVLVGLAAAGYLGASAGLFPHTINVRVELRDLYHWVEATALLLIAVIVVVTTVRRWITDRLWSGLSALVDVIVEKALDNVDRRRSFDRINKEVKVNTTKQVEDGRASLRDGTAYSQRSSKNHNAPARKRRRRERRRQ